MCVRLKDNGNRKQKLPSTIEFSISVFHCHSVISVVWDQYHGIQGRLLSCFLLYSCIINELLTAKFLTFKPERAVLWYNLFLIICSMWISFSCSVWLSVELRLKTEKNKLWLRVTSHKNVTIHRQLPCGMLWLS